MKPDTLRRSEAKADFPIKHVIIAFLLALACYALVYSAIEHRRVRRGPWEVTFSDAGGVPFILINQPNLHITNVQIRFSGEAGSRSAGQVLNPKTQSLPAGRPGLPARNEATPSLLGKPIVMPRSDSTNGMLPITLRFDQPRPVPYDLPLGKCVFMDTTFLPGAVTFRLFGHEIELLPRVLIIDQQDLPWRSVSALEIQP